MTHAPDTGRQQAAALALLLVDGPTLDELVLHGDLADQAEQIAELRSNVAKAEAERDEARRQTRRVRAGAAALNSTVTGLRSELAAVEAESERLRAALAGIVNRVMSGADPLGAALDALEATGCSVLEPSRHLLAVAA
jgi:phage shock protein A